MNKNEVKSQIRGYLKGQRIEDRRIEYVEDIDMETKADRLTIVYRDYPMVPDQLIESCIYFAPDVMEVRVYYSETAARWCKERPQKAELFRLFNYINAAVWPVNMVGDGRGYIYQPKHLFDFRLYMTEDDCCDITVTTVINYDFYTVKRREAVYFLTTELPDLMNQLSLPIFFTMAGKMTAEEAIAWVKENVK